LSCSARELTPAKPDEAARKITAAAKPETKRLN
jgi:hypothetical protein